MASGPVVGTGRFQAEPVAFDSACATNMPLPTFNEPTFHCHVAEVHLDTELGRTSIPRYLAVHDTGTVVDRPGVLGQIQGGVVQGIGQALFEEIIVGDDGSTLNDSLVDYRLPTICDIPDELVVKTVEDFPSRTGPLGAKGIGEAPVMLAPATLASAIRNAAGVRLTALPLSAEPGPGCIEGAAVLKRIGIDVGGTFTDVVVLDEDSGATSWFKSSTDYDNPAEGVLRVVAAACGAGESVSQVKLGTTLGLNAILTRSGATTGLLTTRGFRDVLEIRRTHRKRLFDLNETVPEPLVLRDRRMEITGGCRLRARW